MGPYSWLMKVVNRSYRNTVLSLLPPDSIARLQLTSVHLHTGQTIEFPTQNIEHLVFLERGVAGTTTSFQDGSEVGVQMSGFESVLGMAFLMGSRTSPNHVSMQISGHAYMSQNVLAAQEFARREEFHDLILRSMQARLTESSQTAACNVHHPASQRLALFLLLCEDRNGTGPINLTQASIALMLGTRRTTVSVQASIFQNEGLIMYQRGSILITDRPGLERSACECYAKFRDHFDHDADFHRKLKT